MARPGAFDLNDLERGSHQQVLYETWLAPQFTTGGWTAIRECKIHQGQYHKNRGALLPATRRATFGQFATEVQRTTPELVQA